jgi:membrane-anchored mycosin MYCP
LIPHRSTPSRLVRAVVTVTTGLVLAGTAAGTAHAAAPAPANCTQPGQVVSTVPWPQLMLGPERVWPLTRGDGLTVAVLATGVDATHPALRGVVARGVDVVAGSGPANRDCLGLGTQVAGVIAARPTPDAGFVGFAPRVRVLPVRVLADRRSGGDPVEAPVLARGVTAAVQAGADVIAVPLVTYTDNGALRAAVAAAVRRGVVVVAAAGDLGGAGEPNPRPYPASYDGVVGVGAVDETGERWSRSQHGDYVDVVAPGAAVLTLQRGGGMVTVDGTAMATGFVAGVAALVRARRGPVPPDVLARWLFATALAPPNADGYGHGIVNPYGAVNEQLAGGPPYALPSPAAPTAVNTDAQVRRRRLAVAGAGAALALALVVLVAAAALPRGRRRSWRPSLRGTPPARREPEDPGPPVQLF